MLKRLLFGLLLLAPLASPGHAQTGATVVSTCGSLPLSYAPGATRAITVDLNGQLCAGVSASISGFTAATTGTPITATTGGVTGTLPAGSVVVVTNVGTTNAAYCQLGASASTSSQYISPGGGWFAFTVGANTQVTCATSTSTTTVNLTGGAGLPTGTGGGSGGGGGGSVTQGTMPWIVAGDGTAGVSGTAVLTVQGIASGTALPVTPTNNLAGWGIQAQGSATPTNTTMAGISVASNARTWTGAARGSEFAGSVQIVDASGAQAGVSGAPVYVANQGTSEYPFGSTFAKDSDTGTTSSTVSSLPAVASNYNFVCSISARGVATAATTVNVTLSDGTFTDNYLVAIPDKTLGIVGLVEMIFTPCLPATATNAAWTLTLPAVGTGGVTSTAIKGYYKTTNP